jgi:hypothetical protein
MNYMRMARLLGLPSLLLALTVGITSCATSANYTKILKTWEGAPTDALISSWGPPQSSFPLRNGGEVLEYVRQGSMVVPGQTYYVPQTDYHSGSVYGPGYHRSYSGTYRTYVPRTTPDYEVQLICITRFTINPEGRIINSHWEGNNCKAYPPK